MAYAPASLIFASSNKQFIAVFGFATMIGFHIQAPSLSVEFRISAIFIAQAIIAILMDSPVSKNL
ncbi:hypothetical protein VIBNISFn27_20005 [Vibrio nigripulchritudo SFn27]|uniref:Uncharacterized protein n=1 Tax=Vibrio nigripulchritudo TaxID=28173 RepID=U4KH71_9VIBR|nr:hypothetical protein [Vibrio nigripulchritudo]CCN85328.1 hypothetical protein VIBNIBLFn1_910005 [Vibrio nigripulchritudo BLFn1]CCN87884.1 hypothetical protein VIBNISFn27_20005 [Vibrio nigripulchritudo SFn27]CCN94469.1 hypothetical protein VIBNIENn2_40005 [Vibrio nigripulchritudo ENn2]CCO41394.1 hypothetical protein VIBNISFn135_490005 [Vibrio nigripulchritudo SFn135]CCO54431.1 hypothetical protein VIBNIWn13_690036 [Vibrio nigripulchritudo Wn13]